MTGAAPHDRMPLSAYQRRFAQLIAQLIQYANRRGLELTFGEAWRTPEQAELNSLTHVQRADLVALIADQFPDLARKIAENPRKGTKTSLHLDRLAIDFNLFRDGKLSIEPSDYKILGDYWKMLDPACRFGGDFTLAPDFPHFSLACGDGRA